MSNTDTHAHTDLHCNSASLTHPLLPHGMNTTLIAVLPFEKLFLITMNCLLFFPPKQVLKWENN